jgi:hypothetical protein
VLALKLVLATLTSNPSFSPFSLAWGCKQHIWSCVHQ